jgi:oligopeptide transport system substrate-binding protein
MWYNGAYILSKFAPQNTHVLTKNPGYWDKDNVHITKIMQTYNVDAATLAPELYMSGEVDYADIPANLLPAWQADPAKAANLSPSRVTRDYNYFYCFNFEPRFDAAYEPENWGIAVNNENFRQAIFHALDRASAMEVTFPGRSADLLQYSITPNAFAISETTGKDYTSYGDLAAIWEQNPFEEASAKDYRDKARTELEAAGATFPIKVLFPYNNGMEMWGKENAAIEQQLENLLGADFIDIIVEAADSEGFLENVRRSGKYALLKCNWGADYADPETWTSPFAHGNSVNFAYDTTETLGIQTKTDETMAVIGEYTDLVEAAKAQYSDIDARYNAFAKAEAFYINKAMVIPYGITGGDYQATRLNTFEGEYASFGYAVNRFKYRWVYETGQSEEMFHASQTQWEEHFG